MLFGASGLINPLPEPQLPYRQIVPVSSQLVGMGAEGLAEVEEKREMIMKESPEIRGKPIHMECSF